MIKAVLFDIGGTLHVSLQREGRAARFAAQLIERLGDYGIPIDMPPSEFAKLLHRNSEEYKHFSEETRKEYPVDLVWNDYFLKDFHIGRERLKPFAEELSFLYDYARPCLMRRPHMEETLRTLRAQGYRLGIISNIISTTVMPHILAEYGILDLFDCVVLSSTTGLRKPDAGIFRIAEEQLGLKPEELAYVGDTISRDVIGTRNAGWRLMIQIRNASTAHRDAGLDPEIHKPDYIIEDLNEIPAIIEAENTKEA